MDANYQYLTIRTLTSGWIRINTIQISEVHPMPNGKDVFLVMASGRSYITSGKSGKQILELTKK